MRWPRIRLRWLLSACLISLLLLIPRDCNGMQQVTVIRNNLLCPAPPSLSLASQTEAEMVEQTWLSCGLDMMILQDFRNQFNNLTLLFNIITNSYKTNSKNTSPPVSIKDGISSTLSPEVTSIFLDCLNKHNFRFLDGVSGHRKEEAGSLLLNSDNIEPPFASKRRHLLEVASTSHYSSSRPSKETIRSVLSSTTEGRPLVKSIKKSSKLEPKKQSENSGFSMFVIIGLIVVSIGVVALIFICFCACRGSDSASPYNLTRDDKPLLKLSDLSGSSRKSSASQIDVSRLGALSRSSSKSQETESGLTRLLKERQAGLTAHEITTIGGHQAEKPVVSSSTGSAVVPAGPAPPPPPAPRFAPVPPHPAPHSAAAAPPPAPPSAPPPPPPPAQETAPALPLPPGFAQASDKKDTSAQGSAKKDSSAQGSKKKDTSAHASKLLHKLHNKKDTSAQNAKKKDTSRQESKKKESSAPPPPPKSAGSTNAPTGPPPPPAPRIGAGAGPGPPPPPPKRGGPPGVGPPPPALPGGPKGRGPPPFKKPGSAAGPPVDSNKTKLKPFFWDKVNANPNQGMVWDQIKAGSFQFNEEMIENLFGAQTVDKKGADGKKDGPAKEATQFVRILDAKKAQNLAISLKALNVSAEQVRNAVTEGLDLSSDLIQTLIRWTPTSDEELRLRLYTGEITQLGHAEQFLRTIIDVPYIFQRLEALLFMASLPEEATSVKQSFATLEVACHELKNSRLFKKLLEAVLKTGNRMNDGTFRGGAQAFKLDTLLKLADVKGVDGKTTLLHFVVQEIIRSEGVRAVREAKGQSGSSSSLGGSEQRMSVSSSDDLSEDVSDDTEHYKQLGLSVVSSLGEDLQNVRKAACLDSDALSMTVASLGHRLLKANEFLTTSMKSLDEDSGFHRRLEQFIEQSQVQVTNLLSEEKKMRELVRSTVDYFHGGTAKDEGLRLFVIVRDFLAILNKVCGEVKDAFAKAAAANKKPPAAAGAPPAKGKHPGKQPSQTSLKIKPVIQNRRSSAGRSSSSSSDSDD